MKLTETIKKISNSVGERHCACDDHCHGCTDSAHSSERLPKGGFDPFLAVRLIVSSLVFAATVFFTMSAAWRTALLIAVALLSGLDIVISAVKNVIRKRILDENVLMTVAALAAFMIGEMHEGAAVLILFQFGELLQSYAVGRARSSVIESLDARPDTVTLIRGGREVVVNVSNVAESFVLLPNSSL